MSSPPADSPDPNELVRAQPPAAIETHVSWVFLAGDRAYKLLKPLRMPFLDHRSTEDRLAAIDDELRLNRRIAPDVYLGVADVFEAEELVDRMLVMRRLDAANRLSAILQGRPCQDELRAVARSIASFHADLSPLAGDDAEPASRDAVRGNWQDNFAETERHAGTIFSVEELREVRNRAEAYVEAHGPLFESRTRSGFVRDGHGDLRAEDIYCEDAGPQILDCLAFNSRLRVSDVLLDVAFLCMDIDRLVGATAANAFMRSYSDFSNEHHPASLAHFYVAYRAHVRAKIAVLRFEQGHQDAVAEARSYHALAAQHLRLAEVRIVVVGGGAGVGKSTVANGLSQSMRWLVLSTDELRKDMAGVERSAHLTAAPGAGLYDDHNKDKVYDELLREARAVVLAGETVVLDGSWNAERHRVLARALAEECGVSIVEFDCTLDPAIANERIARRLAGITASDATPEVAEHLRRTRAPWPEAAVLSCEPPIEDVLAQARAILDLR